jgi:hypothetical protein
MVDMRAPNAALQALRWTNAQAVPIRIAIIACLLVLQLPRNSASLGCARSSPDIPDSIDLGSVERPAHPDWAN